MTPENYQKFTEDLAHRLSSDARVLGLIAVGSMAAQDYFPDRWSDHDFFVIVQPGHQEDFKKDLSWLPDANEIVFHFRETAHGLKVLYGNGHLLEFALFDPQELHLAQVNRFRILFNRIDLEGQMQTIRARTAEHTGEKDVSWLLGQFLTNLLVGAGRYQRGEKLSGHFFVKTSALKNLILLCHVCLETSGKKMLDDLDPFRRFEFAFPEAGQKLNDILRLDPLSAAVEMLNFSDEHLRTSIPDYPVVAVEVIRRKLRQED